MAEKRAVKRMVKGSDGKIKLIYIDLDTLQVVQNLDGYRVVNGNNTVVEQTTDPEDPESEVVAIEEAPREVGQGDRADTKSQTTELTPSQKDTFRQGFNKSYVQTNGLKKAEQGRATSASTPAQTATTTVNLGNSTRRSESQSQAGTKENYSGVGFVGNYGPKRPNDPEESLKANISESVRAVFGDGYTVVGTSGKEDEGHQHGSARHKTGKALDYHVVDKDGKRVTDNSMLSDLAMDFAARNVNAGIGYGKNYMGTGSFHMDTTGYDVNPSTLSNEWGDMPTWDSPYGDKNDPNYEPFSMEANINFARETGIGPTPQTPSVNPAARPADQTQSLMQPDERPTYDLEESTTAQKSIDSVGQTSGSFQNMKEGMDTASPAKMASMGFMERTDEQIDTISKAIAGELAGSTLRGLAAGDEEATKEFANVMTTIENRAASKMFGNLDNTLVGSQYNSLLSENLDVTNENYSLFGDTLKEKVKGFYSGTLGVTPDNYEFSSYFNDEISNPSWGSKMEDTTKTGYHTFGSLPEYSPSDDYTSWRDSKTKDYTSYSGKNTWSNDDDTPSEKSGVGRGSTSSSSDFSNYTGSDSYDSPSETSGVGRGSGSGSVGGKTSSSTDQNPGKDKDDKDTTSSSSSSGAARGGWGSRSGSV